MLQASQLPAQAPLQQTPSTQKELLHCDPASQATPLLESRAPSPRDASTTALSTASAPESTIAASAPTEASARIPASDAAASAVGPASDAPCVSVERLGRQAEIDETPPIARAIERQISRRVDITAFLQGQASQNDRQPGG